MFTALDTASPMHFLASMSRRVTNSMNLEFAKEYTTIDLVLALKKMHLAQIICLLYFFQTYWHIVGNLAIGTVLRILNSGQVLDVLNHTYIAMIPKKK